MKYENGLEFVVTSKPLEIVGIGIMNIGEVERNLLIVIDYCTRKAYIKVLKIRTAVEICKHLKEIFNDAWPVTITSNQAKKFE